MKAVLISIQPKWCGLIANGEKTVEVRKTKPKLETPFKAYIYCTASNVHECLMLNEYGAKLIIAMNYKTAIPCGGWIANGKIIGEFVCDCIEDFKEFEYGLDALHRHIKLNACLGYDEIYKYLGFEKRGYGWHISELKIYDKPKELSEFKKINRDCWYANLGLVKRDCPECQNVDCFMQRPPQSWCYVEGKEDEGK